MADVWTALVKGCLAFGQTHAADMVGTSFKDAGTLVKSLAADLTLSDRDTKDALKKLKDDIDKTAQAVKPIIDAVKPHAAAAKTAVTKMADELGAADFGWENAAKGAEAFGDVLSALDSAIVAIAEGATKDTADPAKSRIQTAIKGIKEPWIAPFRSLGRGATAGFDSICRTLFGLDNAGDEFKNKTNWDRANQRLALTLTPGATSAERTIGPLRFQGGSIEAFVSYKKPGRLGVALRTGMSADLRSDKLLCKIIPGEASTTDQTPIAVTLDTKDGLTFGDGPDHRIVLPVRLSTPGFELREMAIAGPDQKGAGDGRIDLLVTVAGKLGDALGVVAEGGGVIIRWKGDPNAAIETLPKPPTGAGLRVRTGLVNGGGYLRYKEKEGEYGALLELEFAKFSVQAFGLLVPEPFSMVIVIGVHFVPKIELSFGFTLNGLGGLLAINRTLSQIELQKSVNEGGLDQLLFPDDAATAAPGILDRLGRVFPARPDGFVVGPIGELGWGSQTGFVRAKIGVILALPDPQLVILGVLRVVVPSPDAPAELRIVDLHIEITAILTSDYFKLSGSLVRSRMAGITVSGHMALFLRWGGTPVFAISAGGFFPKFTPPPELQGMQRMTVDVSPPVDFLKLHAEAYFAITSNSVQFGGAVSLTANLGPVGGKAGLSVDALFQWSPRLYFIFIISAQVEITAFGETVAGVSFRGELSGMKPWRIEGHAAITILLWDVALDVGPIEWGDRDAEPQPTVDPLGIAAAALEAPAAWKPQLPAGMETLVQFRQDEAAGDLVHPLGALEVKQLQVPFETDIDRIGTSAVTSRRVWISGKKFGTLEFDDVSHARDVFAPGHFLALSEEQQMSRPQFEEFPCGLRLSARNGLVHGREVATDYQWETCYPHEPLPMQTHAEKFSVDLSRLIADANAASHTIQVRNPYRTPVPEPDPIRFADQSGVRVVRTVDRSVVAGAPGVTSATVAAERMRALGAAPGELQMINAGFLSL